MKVNDLNLKSYGEPNNGPLAGIRVVDLSLLLPGPLCSMHLADMGAEVIKIENPRVPDMTRLMGSTFTDRPSSDGPSSSNSSSSNSSSEETQRPVTGLFYAVNRNKKSISLNIKRPEGREVLLKLLETADILLEGFRPDTLNEMGIGYESLKEKFPGLIYCGISGYGATGPAKDRAGHDGNYIAESGLLHITGSAGGPPVLPGIQIADTAGGSLLALSGILAALFHRERTGKGQFVDTGMMDGAFGLLSIHAGELAAAGKLPDRGLMDLSGGLPNYAVYETKEGRHVMLGALEGNFFRTFLKNIGREELMEKLQEDPDSQENRESIRRELQAFFSTRSYADLQPLFDHTDCCLTPVLTPEEAFHSEQLKAREAAVALDDPELGPIPVTGSPFHLSGSPVSYRTAPPAHGQHTEEILTSLGYDEEGISALRKRRAI
ncbi:MAG: CoA transferase [Leptospiraceae bacterium]|nr:CoA transferase [Leptospiraceae bacterium]